MANQYINALTDLWNNGGTTFQGISLNVTNSASAADSKLLRLQVGSVDQFSVSKAGVVTSVGAVMPSANDGAAIGASGTAWADLFLASGGVINWLAGDVTITHSANALAFAGATTNGYSFADGPIKPATNDGAALGVSGTAWSDLFLASGAVLNIAAADWVATHSAGILTVGTGDLRVTTAGTNAASVVTVGGTQTLAAKTLTLPQINDTSSDHQYVFAVSELAADRTVTLPLLLAADTFVFADFIQTLQNKTLLAPAITDPVITGTIKEDVYTITDGAAFAIDPTNGSIQFITLGANRTPVAANWDDGENVTLRIDDGTARTITWSTVPVVWKNGTAPTLATAGYTEVNLEKSGGVIRGVHVGDFAS